MRHISLHHIVVPEVRPVELVRIAAKLGCKHVCLFTHLPASSTRFFSVSNADMTDILRVMEDNDVSAYGVTSFALDPYVDIASYEAGLNRGGRLGAQYASVRISDPDDMRASDALRRFGEIASRYNITPSIEFTGYNAPDIVDRTLRIIETAGVGALTIDPLHIVRSKASLETLRRAGSARFGYVQLCDGPLESPESQYKIESGSERLAPGEGEFPLDDILALAPAGRAVSLEVPSERLRIGGLSAEARSRRAVEAARRLLARLEPEE